ncbi:uncharacterized protein K460DRAFT_405108 [Cucurbitaria berberidis CBS 394.84]|uniref:Uncharacterized protein n=1 Tax=Cucurbitaria berberidis CBS 394.84 TaxID=1168544 RepID=A0A9P4GG56_9PLEO|nr:uncharacterized protein K460DRAFT_405108 [Cucurbitaria berberidis CBS 394.84]KAF1844829.1 hypothetical protein K460DRAFT_405108 [Cucurbitaria berberidis CBS 394.84]
MSNLSLHEQSVRNRKRPADVEGPEGPPVPPKPNNTNSSLAPTRRVYPPEIRQRLKPLPPVPSLGRQAALGLGDSGSKPLPETPKGIGYGTIVLGITGFCVWFVLIVVLLPVITEKDAMPGFNRWLRSWRP